MKLGNNIIISLLLAAATASCSHIDDERIPAMPVYVPFSSVGVWDLYGVSGAGDSRCFIMADRVPANYPYTALTATGYGGVLLVSDIHSQPVAYDLACPVECSPATRVWFDSEAMVAECPVCHSTYDVVTNYGYPLSGPAADKGYALQLYAVSNGANGLYCLIHN